MKFEAPDTPKGMP